MRYVLFALLLGGIGAGMAARKGRNPLAWFLLCALAPLVLAVLALLPPLPVRGSTKKCPACGELIRAEAKKCRYCGEPQALEMFRE